MTKWISKLVWILVASVPALLAQDQAIPKPLPKPPAKRQLRPRATASEGVVSKAEVAPAASSSGATLLVMCDLACNWKLDGEAKGKVDADGSAKIRVELGEHSLSATAQDGPDQFRRDIEVKTFGQIVVHIDLGAVRSARLQQEAAQVTWTDPSTSLIWTRKDNGRNVSWEQAVSYCEVLRLDGHADWQLPTINQLQEIYDETVSITGRWIDGSAITWHAKGNLQLTGWQWSSSRPAASGEAWYFLLNDGRRFPTLLGNSMSKRALCVRRYGE